jgi:hypothetical protein
MGNKCLWIEQNLEFDIWMVGCNPSKTSIFSPRGNDIKYCPYCGKEIQPVYYLSAGIQKKREHQQGKLKLIEWRRFVHRWGAVIPVRFWNQVRELLQSSLDRGEDWKFVAHDLIGGIQELVNDENRFSLYRIINIEEEGKE